MKVAVTSPGLGMEAMRKRGNNEDEGSPQEKGHNAICLPTSVCAHKWGYQFKQTPTIHTVAPRSTLLNFKKTSSFQHTGLHIDQLPTLSIQHFANVIVELQAFWI